MILENVPGLIHSGCMEHVLRSVRAVPGYSHLVLKLNTAWFGPPQLRWRVYIIMLRTDALATIPETARLAIKTMVIKSKARQQMPFPQWLEAVGWPLPTPSDESPGPRAAPCPTCGIRKACPTHPCSCSACRQHGPEAKSCKWRVDILTFAERPRERARARALLQSWRKIRKDKHLKTTPSYFELAARRKLPANLKSPRERCLLDVLSRSRNLMHPCAVLDVSQSMGRMSFRADGLVPTLTSTCKHIFVPNVGVALGPQQCLALQGMDPERVCMDGISGEQACHMAGNAMSVPVVGVLLWAAYCQLR